MIECFMTSLLLHHTSFAQLSCQHPFWRGHWCLLYIQKRPRHSPTLVSAREPWALLRPQSSLHRSSPYPDLPLLEELRLPVHGKVGFGFIEEAVKRICILCRYAPWRNMGQRFSAQDHDHYGAAAQQWHGHQVGWGWIFILVAVDQGCPGGPSLTLRKRLVFSSADLSTLCPPSSHGGTCTVSPLDLPGALSSFLSLFRKI